MPILIQPWFRSLPARLMPLLRLLPSHCALCGELAGDPVCAHCEGQYFNLLSNRCPCCGIALPHHASPMACSACLRHPPAFDATIVATDYSPPVDQLVLALKFRHQLALAPALSRMIRRAIEQSGLEHPDLLTAVPLGRQRLAERGFNQSLEMARALAKALGIQLDKHGVLRQRETPPQSLLPPDERRKNMRHAFTVSSNAIDLINDRHVAVVDDVMTTGETLNELAATLKRFGAARVTNLVFARALPQ
jgi:ComF family protein